jgi:endonuclease III
VTPPKRKRKINHQNSHQQPLRKSRKKTSRRQASMVGKCRNRGLPKAANHNAYENVGLEEMKRELFNSYARGQYNEDLVISYFKKLVPLDPGLAALLCCYEQICRQWNKPCLLRHAISGVRRGNLVEIFRQLLPDGDFSPPRLVNQEENLVEYSKPGQGFFFLAKELLSTLTIFLNSLDWFDLAPIRWHWAYNLLVQINLLGGDDEANIRLFAFMICLNLSCATGDLECIVCTVALYEAGLLTPRAMSMATEEEVARLIRPSGIFNQRAKYLIAFAKEVMDKHGGVVPWDISSLESFRGFGEKTKQIMLTEVFGCYCGIPADKHVVKGVLAYGLVHREPGEREFDPVMAQASLREWVPARHLPSVNKILGSFAQLFTQVLVAPQPINQNGLGLRVMRAMMAHLHQPAHIELVWCCIRLVRDQYPSTNPAIA